MISGARLSLSTTLSVSTSGVFSTGRSVNGIKLTIDIF